MPDAAIPQNAPEELVAYDAKEPLTGSEAQFNGSEAIPQAPEPIAIGNESVAIYNHRYTQAARDSRGTLFPAHVALAIGNETSDCLATVVFQAVFYDQRGTVVDTVRHREHHLVANRSRAVRIPSSLGDINPITSYAVKIIRMSTADSEPVQLRRREITTTADGQEQVSGTVMNISAQKTDAAVTAAFYDANEETIGNLVLVVRDIEPDSVRSFELRFKPPQGESVRRCAIQVGRLAGEL